MNVGSWAAYSVPIALYGVCVLVFCAVEWKRRGAISAVAKGVFSLAMPILGLLILVLYEGIGNALALMGRTGPKEEDVDLSMSLGEHDYSGDIVPLRDAFLMDDAKEKRRFFTDAIKQDVVDSQAILQEAVHDSDREIAYYAVSMMAAHMEQLGAEIYELEEDIRRGIDDDETLEEYVGKVREFLVRQYGDAATRAQQRTRYLETLRALAERHPEHPAYYAEEIRELIRSGAFEAAAKACAAFRAKHPTSETPLLLLLQLDQAAHDRAHMQETIEALKKLPTRLSNEAMQAIRYWGGGAARE